MKLDPNLAQSIVDKMMENIPYNINMMNEDGYIIASGNKKRLHTLHIGAIDIIKSGKTKPMIKSLGKYGQPGVNMPVEFDGKIIGVIGITGDPDKVTPLASLLKVSTELLLSQINNSKLEHQKKESLNHFLYQWTDSNNPLKNNELKLTAQALKIDLDIKRFIIIIQTKDKNNIPVLKNDLSFNRASNEKLIISSSEKNLNSYLKLAQNNSLLIGISDKTTDLKTAVNQAQSTIDISQILNLKNIYYFKQVRFLNHLLNSDLHSERFLSVFKSFLKSKNGLELLETIDCYFKSDGNVTETSKKLNIHRNTTNYRLNNISEYFNLDLHDLTDTMQLYINYLFFKKYLYNHK